MSKAKTGKLKSVNEGKFLECVDCKTSYPFMDGVYSCNGVAVTVCPWCRPDSEPWKNGRGV